MTQTPIEFAMDAVLFDERRSDTVAALMGQFNVSEELAHDLVTAAQRGYLSGMAEANPEEWQKLGLKRP